jgi:hypothetical protein
MRSRGFGIMLPEPGRRNEIFNMFLEFLELLRRVVDFGPA